LFNNLVREKALYDQRLIIKEDHFSTSYNGYCRNADIPVCDPWI